MLELFSGDDWDIIFNLQKDGVAFDASTATEIKAAIVDSDGAAPSTIISEVVLDSGATGANWSSGILIIEIPNASTNVSAQRAYVEVQVTIGGKKQTWPRRPFDIKTGTIA